MNIKYFPLKNFFMKNLNDWHSNMIFFFKKKTILYDGDFKYVIFFFVKM